MKKKVLLVGASQMAVDYYQVLHALNCEITIIGRGKTSADFFEKSTGADILTGGLEDFLKNNPSEFDAAIVAVGVEQLEPSCQLLLQKGFKKILVEKPAGINDSEIRNLAGSAISNSATILVGYNRRFYASVRKAREIIVQDGGVTSFHFEFTEWAHEIEPLTKRPGIKENWFMVNSSHIIDMAFYMCGQPSELSAYTAGELSWHKPAVFAGSGKTSDDILFTYMANWNAPGRWNVEILTKNSRLIFRPIEDLQIQLKGSVAINKVEFDTTLDKEFKPGLFLQTKSFLIDDFSEFKTISQQVEMMDIYNNIAKR
ncbi:hypothetical protein BH09BAC5_BH09BAC5_28200 [soil metagenome]